jgi:hypothetical protein
MKNLPILAGHKIDDSGCREASSYCPMRTGDRFLVEDHVGMEATEAPTPPPKLALFCSGYIVSVRK